MNFKIAYLAVFTLSFFLVSCGDDDSTDTASVQLNISGLEDLGPDYAYEGWLIVNGSAVSAGIFNVDADGILSNSSFELNKEDVDNATAYVLTIEPSPDADPSPSKVHILAGDFGGSSAAITVGHGSALASSFSDAAGDYILATPTDDDDSNEASGIWFLNNSSGTPAPGLDLPSLPQGWAYEGWVVIDGTPVSTGAFTVLDSADDSAPFSGPNSGPSYPGEDFLQNAPSGLSFPTDITGGTAVISIEPVPDNSAAPFLLKPLVGTIPANADVHTVLSMGQNLNFPSGSVTR